MNCTLRRASVADAEKILPFLSELHAESLDTVLRAPELPSLEEERAFLKQFEPATGNLFLMAVRQEKVIGTLSFTRHLHPQQAHAGELGMAVASHHRRNGIGRSLLSGLLEWCRRSAIRRVELKVMAHNHAAIGLYEKMGFRQEGRHPGAIRLVDRFEDMLDMALILDYPNANS